MGGPRLKVMWRCGECGDLYEWEFAARDCCQPEVLQVYACPDCGECHEEMEKAVACCKPEDELTCFDYRRLEEAGQQRLF